MDSFISVKKGRFPILDRPSDFSGMMTADFTKFILSEACNAVHDHGYMHCSFHLRFQP